MAELAIKSYGAAAAVSVAFSDAGTVSGKAHDALVAVPNLVERYRDARYAVARREEVQAALDEVHRQAPDAEQLETAAQESAETVAGIEATLGELDQAKDAVAGFELIEAGRHVNDAWAAKPDLDSIRQVGDLAETIAPLLHYADVLTSRLYGGLLLFVDNFASDEIAATLGVMAVAFALAYAVGTAVGFWARRGRPGLVARGLQRAGARVFRGWYVRNAEYALTPPLYAAARQRIQDDIVADPREALDPAAFRELEAYFGRRRSGQSSE